MKKSLLAVAIAAALPAAAFAQSNVTMYGIVDASIGTTNNGAGSAVKVDAGVLSSSRWGVRGSEDLGGGLKANFNLEAGLNNDDGTGKTGGALDFRRRAVVGLSGGFGDIRLGRDYTAAFLMAGSWDVLGYGHYGNTLSYTAGLGGTSVRFSNAIHYNTPDMGGFNASASLGFGEVAGDQSQGRAFSLAGGYAAGPLNVGAYFENTNSLGVVNAAVVTAKKFGLGGGYNFGAFGLKAGYQRLDNGAATNNKTNYINIGGNVNIGPGSLLLQVSRAAVDALPNKITTFGIAYDYPLSKRTMGYVTYGQANNNGTLFSSDTSVAAAAGGTTQKGFAVGVRHSF
jgi:predicted porin